MERVGVELSGANGYDVATVGKEKCFFCGFLLDGVKSGGVLVGDRHKYAVCGADEVGKASHITDTVDAYFDYCVVNAGLEFGDRESHA